MAPNILLGSAPFFVPIVLAVIGIVLGSIAWYRSSSLYLPIPTSLTAVGTFLPIITLLITTAGRVLRHARSTRSNTSNNPREWMNRLSSLLNELLVPLQTAIAVLAITYLTRGQILSCQLGEQWQSYFHNKDERAIRAIQDSFECCGFRSTRDRAWPFNDANHGDDACTARFGYQQSCINSWEGAQVNTATMVLAAAIFSWFMKLFLENYRSDQPWMNTTKVVHNGGSNPRLLPFSDTDRAGEVHEDTQASDHQEQQALPAHDEDVEEGWRSLYPQNSSTGAV